MGFLKKSIYFAAWAKIILAKYISAWLLAEGAVILSGLAYNGRWEDGSIKWNGGANVKLRVFEKSTRFQHYIDSFNINTNAWVMSYVYKRLRFLNSKVLSQLGALVSIKKKSIFMLIQSTQRKVVHSLLIMIFLQGFLALWHGWHPGYYICFFNEFLVMQFEKSFFPLVDNK